MTCPALSTATHSDGSLHEMAVIVFPGPGEATGGSTVKVGHASRPAVGLVVATIEPRSFPATHSETDAQEML